MEKNVGENISIGATHMMAPDEYFLNLNSIPSLRPKKNPGHATPLLAPSKSTFARLINRGPLEEAYVWSLTCLHDTVPCGYVWICHIPWPFLGWGQCWVSQSISFSMQQRMFLSYVWGKGFPPSLLLSCIWRLSSWEWGLFLADVNKTKTRSSWETVISWALIVL